MKIENEVKYKLLNIEAIKKGLSLSGFLFLNKSKQKDYYFSPPHKSFANSKKYYLRLRLKSNNKGIWAYHEVKNDIQTKEWEVEVDNVKVFLSILKVLDFDLDAVVEKTRITYKKKGIQVLIDEVKKLGNFIEIEFDRNKRKEVDKIVDFFNLKKENIVTGMGYPDLLKKYAKN
jgi:predicted adenylyl cyclase CyaB